MSENPIFDRILGSGSDPSDNTVTVAFGVNETEGVRIDMTYPVAVQLAGILAAQIGKLSETMTEDERASGIPLDAESIYLGQGSSSQPLIVLELAGGAPLALRIEPNTLQAFAQEVLLLSTDQTGRLQ